MGHLFGQNSYAIVSIHVSLCEHLPKLFFGGRHFDSSRPNGLHSSARLVMVWAAKSMEKTEMRIHFTIRLEIEFS